MVAAMATDLRSLWKQEGKKNCHGYRPAFTVEARKVVYMAAGHVYRSPFSVHVAAGRYAVAAMVTGRRSLWQQEGIRS